MQIIQSKFNESIVTMQCKVYFNTHKSASLSLACRFYWVLGDFFLQYVLSGSDDFRLYMWKIPEDLSSSKFSVYKYYDIQYFDPFNNQILIEEKNLGTIKV